MLGQYVTIDGVKYPNTKKPKFKYNNGEIRKQSEGYTDLLSIHRLQKLTNEFTFRVDSKWRNKIKQDCMKPIVNAVIIDKVCQGTLRLIDEEIVEGSEFIPNTNGLWIMKVVFTES